MQSYSALLEVNLSLWFLFFSVIHIRFLIAIMVFPFDVTRVLSPSSEVNSTPRSTDDLGHDLRRRVQMPEDNIGPSRPLLQQEAFVQNQTQQAQQSKEKNPSLSQPTASTKVESKAMPNAKAKQVKSIYGDMAGGSGNSKAATKKKGASGQGTAGKRSSMDEPPSIDMIAKFAAEKEKYVKTVKSLVNYYCCTLCTILSSAVFASESTAKETNNL